MRPSFAAVLALLAVVAHSVGQQPAQAPKPPAPPASRAAAPKTDFPPFVKKDLHATNDLRGKKAPRLEVATWLTSQPNTKGKVVLIDFWATWCGPCRRLIPELEAWQEKYKQNLVVIGISDEHAATVREHFKGTSMKYAMAVDPAAKMKKRVGVSGIPHVLIIGSDNIVRWQGFPGEGADRLTEAKLKQIIDADIARVANAPGGDSPVPPNAAPPSTAPKPAEQRPAAPDASKPTPPSASPKAAPPTGDGKR